MPGSRSSSRTLTPVSGRSLFPVTQDQGYPVCTTLIAHAGPRSFAYQPIKPV